MSPQRKAGAFLALAVLLPLAGFAALILVVAPIVVVSALFAVGMALFGLFSWVWLGVLAIRDVRARQPAPQAAPAVVRPVPIPVQRVPLPVRAQPVPAQLVIVRVTAVVGMCPLQHLWHEGEMFLAGPHTWPSELECPRAQRMIQAEAATMLTLGAPLQTLHCHGPKHGIDFELQPASAESRERIPVTQN